MLRDWYRIRPVVLARDRHICQFCGQYATTVDHITPRSAGGTDELDNLRALCTPCHAKRSAAQGGIASGSVRGT
jgi:5-methylcytosine-specific restriction protein A